MPGGLHIDTNKRWQSALKSPYVGEEIVYYRLDSPIDCVGIIEKAIVEAIYSESEEVVIRLEDGTLRFVSFADIA